MKKEHEICSVCHARVDILITVDVKDKYTGEYTQKEVCHNCE